MLLTHCVYVCHNSLVILRVIIYVHTRRQLPLPQLKNRVYTEKQVNSNCKPTQLHIAQHGSHIHVTAPTHTQPLAFLNSMQVGRSNPASVFMLYKCRYRELQFTYSKVKQLIKDLRSVRANCLETFHARSRELIIWNKNFTTQLYYEYISRWFLRTMKLGRFFKLSCF